MLIPFEVLFKKNNIKSKQVLHIGANTGQEAEEYARLGMEKVVWVEAHPQTYRGLVDHVKAFKGQHHTIHACVGDVEGEKVTFNVANNGSQSSSIFNFGTHSREHPQVKFVSKIEMTMTRLDNLLTEHHIDFLDGSFLNIDLQGAELKALIGLGRYLGKFNHVYVEVNEEELYAGCPLVGEIDSFLHYAGFIGVEKKMTGSGWGDKYYRRI